MLSASLAELKLPEGAVCGLMTRPPEEIAARLTQRGMKHLYIDGGVTIQCFLRAGPIQRFLITRIPVLLGSGIPLFGPLEQHMRLRHIGISERDGAERVYGCRTVITRAVQ